MICSRACRWSWRRLLPAISPSASSKDYGDENLNRFAGNINELVDASMAASAKPAASSPACRRRSDADHARQIPGRLRRVAAERQQHFATLQNRPCAKCATTEGSIHGNTNEIRSAADDLSKRTEQQAASVEETSAALEQITTTVKDSSKRAEEVGNLVGEAK
jgi:methyl-accepting chemotaxis protein